ncbi:unnamed protein product [Lampetra fluviatilis]
MAQLGSVEALTDEHGFRCFPPPGTSPDGVAAAVAEHIGPAAVHVVQKENRGYVVYVATVDAAARVVEKGLSVGGEGGLLVHTGHIRKNCSARTKEGVERSGRAATEEEKTRVPQLQQPRQPQQQQQREHPPPPQQEQRQQRQQRQKQQGGADSVPGGESAPGKKTDDDGGGFTVVRNARKKRKTSRRENGQLKRAATAGDTVEPASRPVEMGGEAMEATGDVHPADATKPGTRSPNPASPTPTRGGEGLPTTAGAIGVPGGAATLGSTPSPALRGGGEGSAEPEATGQKTLPSKPAARRIRRGRPWRPAATRT